MGMTSNAVETWNATKTRRKFYNFIRTLLSFIADVKVIPLYLCI